MARCFRRGAALLAGLLTLLPALPVRALEEVVVELPLLESTLTVNLRELRDPVALQQGSSELAELDRASGGALGRSLLKLLNQPMPLAITQLATTSVGSPLLEQALLLVSSFGAVEGQSTDLSGAELRDALLRAAAASPSGQATLLQLMEAIPGQRVQLNLSQAQQIAKRLIQQRSAANRLLAAATPAPAAPATAGAAAAISRGRLAVPHRSAPLELLVMQPSGPANGQLVLISHGLWDSPQSFQGWGQVLAARGYAVLMPWHPGSDAQQQTAVLTGTAPPPSPDELTLRGRDLIAILDAVAAGQLVGVNGVDAQRVVVIGHSWGATTALQLAGVKPSEVSLQQRCSDLNHPDRNLSWTLQCSWLTAVDQAALQDPRVIAVAAVSPPLSLLFPPGSGRQMSGRALLVSGSHDWVVPPDPEAIEPLRQGRPLGNQLVLVQGGDHFNLRPGEASDGGVLGPLLAAWTDSAFAAGAAVRPAADAAPLLGPGAWGSAVMPIADVTGAIQPR